MTWCRCVRAESSRSRQEPREEEGTPAPPPDTQRGGRTTEGSYKISVQCTIDRLRSEDYMYMYNTNVDDPIRNPARFTAGWLEVTAGLIRQYKTATSPNNQCLPCSRTDLQSFAWATTHM